MVVAVAGAGCPVLAAIVAPAAAEPDALLDFFLPFFFSYLSVSTMSPIWRGSKSHLLPSPNRPEAVKESDILEQIWVKP